MPTRKRTTRAIVKTIAIRLTRRFSIGATSGAASTSDVAGVVAGGVALVGLAVASVAVGGVVTGGISVGGVAVAVVPAWPFRPASGGADVLILPPAPRGAALLAERCTAAARRTE